MMLNATPASPLGQQWHGATAQCVRHHHPAYVLEGWLESYVNGKNMAVHEELLRKAGPRIDNQAPKKAMQFRDFLKS